jgi:DNA-binding CsgD family transcriptional regulator
MGAQVPTGTRRRRDELVRRIGRADDVAGVFAEASPRLRRLVPFDASAWMTTDPATGLPTGPTRIEDLGSVTSSQCSEHWRREYTNDDVNRFAVIARAERPAATLRGSAPDPHRSARYRGFLQPLGFHDELRAVLRSGDTPWGTVTLWRRAGQPAFTSGEAELVAGLSERIGEQLRLRARPTGPAAGLVRHDRPGMMLFDDAGELISVNEQARAWLAELPADPGPSSDLGVVVPIWLTVAVVHARVSAETRPGATTRIRVRSRRGPWVVCHASCLAAADGSLRETAVVIEAAKPAEIAPIIVEAYDLSAREQEITRLIARGAGTAEIAGGLLLSPHTVRDHVKAIFAKVEVSSRGELVAKLFAEHYEPAYAEQIVRTQS